MKKSKLIKMLLDIEGEIDVRFWNGFVQDWMEFSPELVEVNLYKKTESYYIENVRRQMAIEKKDWDYKISEEDTKRLKNAYKRVCKWQTSDYVSDEDVREKRYSIKKVFMMQSKTRGVDTFDMSGRISY